MKIDLNYGWFPFVWPDLKFIRIAKTASLLSIQFVLLQKSSYPTLQIPPYTALPFHHQNPRVSACARKICKLSEIDNLYRPFAPCECTWLTTPPRSQLVLANSVETVCALCCGGGWVILARGLGATNIFALSTRLLFRALSLSRRGGSREPLNSIGPDDITDFDCTTGNWNKSSSRVLPLLL